MAVEIGKRLHKMDTNDRLMNLNCKKSDEAVRKVRKVAEAMIEISAGMY